MALIPAEVRAIDCINGVQVMWNGESATIYSHKNGDKYFAWEKAPTKHSNFWEVMTHGMEGFPSKWIYAWSISTERCTIISNASVSPVKSIGMHCANKLCNEYNDYGQPNQPDKKTYYCYSCKNLPAWKRK
jgi:hypothetical protein